MKKGNLVFSIVCAVLLVLVLAFGAVWHHTNWVRPYLKPEEPPTSEVPGDEETPPVIDAPTVTFVADGVTVDSIKYAVGSEITEPSVPDKAGYTGAWESYELDGENITVNAVYEVITYTITYYGYKTSKETFDLFNSSQDMTCIVDTTVTYPTTYTVESEDITIPKFLSKAYYSSTGYYTSSDWYLDFERTQKFDGVIEKGSIGDIKIYVTVRSGEDNIPWLPLD